MGIIQSLESLLKLKDYLPSKYEEETYFEYAQKQETKGNIQEAIECYEIILSHNSSHYESYDRLFHLYEDTKQWAKLKELAESFNKHLWYLKMDHWKEYHNKATHGLWEEEQKKKSACKANSNVITNSEHSNTASVTNGNRTFVGPPRKEDYKSEEDMPVMRQFLTKEGKELIWTKNGITPFEDFNKEEQKQGRPGYISLKRSGNETYCDYYNPRLEKSAPAINVPKVSKPKPKEQHEPIMVRVVDTLNIPTESNFTLHGQISVIDFIEEKKLQLPEFDFYTGDASEAIKRNAAAVQKLIDINDSISKDYARTVFYINEKRYDFAVKGLEEMVAFDLPTLKPHVKLMELYHEIGWKDIEQKALDQIITKYEIIKSNSLKEFLALADKYHSRAWADKKITEGKRVSYFDNLYDVYNPYSELDILKKMQKELV